jgi:hypothetical protein
MGVDLPMTSLILLLSACDAGSGDVVVDDAPVEAVPYIYTTEDTATASLTVSDLELRVADALASTWTIDATPVFDAYEAVMTGADGYCPNYYELDGNQYWYDDCTSDLGAAFSGYAFFYRYDGDVIDGLAYTGAALYGVGSATSAEGARLEFGGSAQTYTAVPDGVAEDSDAYYVYSVSQVQGGFAYDASTEGWLSNGEAPDLVSVGYYVPSYAGIYVYVDGSPGSSEEGATVFDELILYSENLMPDCPNEPYGGISVRDVDGEWYDIIFHGPSEYGEAVDSALCDGCGDAYFHGELLGEVCADFSVLTNWEVSPWSE